jgi:hypothetical protein
MKPKIFFDFCALSLTCIVSLSACTKMSASQNDFNLLCRPGQKQDTIGCQLAQAQQQKNLPKIQQIVGKMLELRGAEAGVPEKPTEFQSVTVNSRQLTPTELRRSFTPYVKKIERQSWWISRPSSTELNVPLRFFASIITGTLAARRAGAEDSQHLLQMAESAGNYLIQAQAQGKSGLFPFPSTQGQEGRSFGVAERYLNLAKQQGKIGEALINGWIIKDIFKEGGLQFDNGLCGVAMIELYEATGKEKYKRSALEAADWAVAQPLVPNWNYNSFSIFLLAHAYRITGNRTYLQSAKEKARFGIYPGQLKTGSNRGRWLDGHNAQFSYHYIIMRSLGALIAVLPKNDPDFPQAFNTLSLGLQWANTEIIEKGVASADTTLEVLSRLQLALPASSGRLPNLGRSQALALVGRYASAKLLNGRDMVSPEAWGLFLETLNTNSEGKKNDRK